MQLKQLKICSRGHKFYKTPSCTVCPKCWPGQRVKLQSDFPVGISAPALRALNNAKIKNLNELAGYTTAQILKLHGVGPASIPILKKALAKLNLDFSK